MRIVFQSFGLCLVQNDKLNPECNSTTAFLGTHSKISYEGAFRIHAGSRGEWQARLPAEIQPLEGRLYRGRDTPCRNLHFSAEHRS